MECAHDKENPELKTPTIFFAILVSWSFPLFQHIFGNILTSLLRLLAAKYLFTVFFGFLVIFFAIEFVEK